MGRSRKVKFVVKMSMSAPPGMFNISDPSEWQTKYAGRPTDANLEKHVQHFEISTQPGGCNSHLGVRTVYAAEILDQKSGQIVAQYALGQHAGC